MPKTSVYLPDDLSEYVSTSEVNLSGLLQEAIRAHRDAHNELEARFRAELRKYRTSPDRRAEWEAQFEPMYPFTPCETCGTGVDEGEGCLAMFDPYNAVPVALLAHYPDDLRRASLQYWADSGYTDVALGPQ